ncbi:MAG: DUF2264 domain-containing protein [Pseudomonadota bacterium]
MYVALVAISAIATVAFLYLFFRRGNVEGWSVRFTPSKVYEDLDAELKKRFAQQNPSRDDYLFAAKYFLQAYTKYLSDDGAYLNYPGEPGVHGLRVEGLEGFARLGVLAASWIVTQSENVSLPSGETVDLLGVLSKGIQNGTDPSHSSFWGDIGDRDQRIVEAGDIAVIVAMLGSRLDERFSVEGRKNLWAWLETAVTAENWGGNWSLFNLMCTAVLTDAGHFTQQSAKPFIEQHLDSLRSIYIGNGWFDESLGGRPDLYNAWQFPYYIYMLQTLSRSFSPPDWLAKTPEKISRTLVFFHPLDFHFMGGVLHIG